MRTECIIYTSSHNDSTPDEPWTSTRDETHHYAKQADFALEGLGRRAGKCLVIGSPLFEAVELSEAGWDVTYVDVREPPGSYPFEFINGDASTLDLGESIYDAASTTCVLCHAGMGRYGDPLSPEADELILNNILKSLKTGAHLAVTFGPVVNTSMPMRFGNTHRLYNYQTVLDLTRRFNVITTRILDIDENQWIKAYETSNKFGKDYISMILEKP